MDWAWGQAAVDSSLNIFNLRTYRIVIPPENIRRSGNVIQVFVRGPAITTPFTIEKMYVGHASQVIGSDPYDFDGHQVQILFNGSASKVFTQGVSEYSDHVIFALSADRPLVVSAFVRCSAVQLTTASSRGSFGAYHYYKRNVDDAAITEAFGYTGPINNAPFVFGILAPESYSTTTSTSTSTTSSSTASSTKTTMSGWTTSSSTVSSTTSTTFYVPDADIGFEHEDIAETFIHEDITETFTHVAVSVLGHEEIDSTFIHDIISSTWTEVIEVSDRKPALETIYKQPDESYPVYADFVNVLATGETLLMPGCDVLVEDKEGVDVTVNMVQGLSIQGTKLKTQLQSYGAESASPYKITFQVVTSLGNVYEIDGKIRVVDL
jgi:hypothetical protein